MFLYINSSLEGVQGGWPWTWPKTAPWPGGVPGGVPGSWDLWNFMILGSEIIKKGPKKRVENPPLLAQNIFVVYYLRLAGLRKVGRE